MNPYQFYVSQPYYTQLQYDPYREPPQAQTIEKRVSSLERQNTHQVKELSRLSEELSRQNKEIHRLNGEINRINQELTRLNDMNVKQTRQLNRLNTRLRVVENRLTIPFTPTEGGF
jgi:septal ring factor EnvC (AmiA/AmiB activator)